jgi:hypothetical protein
VLMTRIPKSLLPLLSLAACTHRLASRADLPVVVDGYVPSAVDVQSSVRVPGLGMKAPTSNQPWLTCGVKGDWLEARVAHVGQAAEKGVCSEGDMAFTVVLTEREEWDRVLEGTTSLDPGALNFLLAPAGSVHSRPFEIGLSSGTRTVTSPSRGTELDLACAPLNPFGTSVSISWKSPDKVVQTSCRVKPEKGAPFEISLVVGPPVRRNARE